MNEVAISKHNDGFKFVMVVIDVLTKYVWLDTVKSRYRIAIKNAKVIQTDKRTKFFNVLVKTYLADKNIKLFSTHSEQKSQTVERLNRTIKRVMFRYFIKKNRRRYIDISQAIASEYNAYYHRSVKMAPKDVNKDKETQVWINLYEKRL